MKNLFKILVILLHTTILLSCVKSSKTEIQNKEFQFTTQTGYTAVPIPKNMVLIDSGNYIPLYGKVKDKVHVKQFELDVYPVTNANYLEFVKLNPKWRKSGMKKIFADANYLKDWQNDTTLGVNMLPNSPITNVSWYAANAFCESVECRLPTLDEWEYVAMADQESIDARKEKSYNQYILDWYEKNNTFKNEIGKTYKNKWGVYDMHGLVWEWTNDFSSVLISGENRGNAGNDKNLFCGSSSLGASDLMNYAAFMRYAFRSSLKANYCVQNLGFRCVKIDIQN